MKRKMVMAVCLASCAMAFGQGKDDFMRQQAYAEMQRVTGQVDVLQSNLSELQTRVGRLEGGGDSKNLRQEIEAEKERQLDALTDRICLNSDEYLEREARDRFNFVNPGDLIIKIIRE